MIGGKRLAGISPLHAIPSSLGSDSAVSIVFVNEPRGLSIHAVRPALATDGGMMNAWTSGLFSFVFAVIAADFLVGFVHWIEDAYVREDWPVLGPLVGRPNILHHHLPRHFVRNSWMQSCWDQLLLAGVIVGIAWSVDGLSWPVMVFAVLVGNANEIHKWAHRSRRENGRLITLLQDLHLIQGARHHAIHHTDPKSTHYCVITECLNPVLERLRFWTRLECLLWRWFRARRRADRSNRRHGPAPEWIRLQARGPGTA
jgi:ubiquitin-conjugating enzyme E2 variant